MEMEDQKPKHVCKLCNKRYPCGKSLGGHMRSHMIGNSAESQERKKILSENGGKNSSKRESEVEGGGHSSYGLRENPKKTWRLSNSRNSSQQENVCKECGKLFQSLKALCGHMASHSEKERVSSNLEDRSWNNACQNPAMDWRKRSKRASCSRNRSPSVSAIEQEQQELAICLMMLSRDSGHRGGLNSLPDSSDNNSVVLETKSSSIDMRISRGEDMNCVSDGDGDGENVETKKSGDDGKKDSDSGYFINGAQVESDVSVDGFSRNLESLELKLNDGSESGKNSLKRLKCMKSESGKTELGKVELKQEGYDKSGRDSSMEYNSSKRAKNHSFFEKNPRKRSNYECVTCNKTFHSHHALGGHRANHKRVEESDSESNENGIETDTCPGLKLNKNVGKFVRGKTPIAQNLSGKINGHKCPICFKVFRSGQALGGHKKSHFGGACEEDEHSRTSVMKQDPLEIEIPGLIDLNLLPPVEEEANNNDHEHEHEHEHEHVGLMTVN